MDEKRLMDIFLCIYLSLGLPLFFQKTGTTVIDELIGYELGGDLDEILDSNEDDLALPLDGFGDLKTDNLPEFFLKPKPSEIDELAGMISLQSLEQKLMSPGISGPPPGFAREPTPSSNPSALPNRLDFSSPPPSVTPQPPRLAPTLMSPPLDPFPQPPATSFFTPKKYYGHGKMMHASDVR